MSDGIVLSPRGNPMDPAHHAKGLAEIARTTMAGTPLHFMIVVVKEKNEMADGISFATDLNPNTVEALLADLIRVVHQNNERKTDATH